MQSVSDNFLDLVKGSNTPVFTADVFYDGQLYFAKVAIEDGSASFTSDQAVRGQIDLTLVDPDNELVPTSLSSPLTPYGGYINVRAGFSYLGGEETVSLGWFDITEVEVEEAYKDYLQDDGTITRVPAGARIRVTAVDFMQRVVDYNFLNPDVARTDSYTNLLTNGGLTTNDLTGWSGIYGTNGSGNMAAITKRAFKGGVSGNLTWTANSTSAAAGGVSYAEQSFGMIVGSSYSFSMVVRPNKTRTMAAKINIGGTTFTGASTSCPANQWTRLTVTTGALVSPLSGTLTVSAVQATAAVWAKNDTLDFDDARLIQNNAPYQWTIWDEIQRLVQEVVPCSDPDFDTPSVPVGIIYDGDRFDAINKLAKYAGCEPIMAPDGTLTLRKLIDGDLAPDVDWQVNLTSYSKKLTRNSVYNAVVARGKDACSLSINRYAYIESGPFAFDGAMGRRPFFYESDLLNTGPAVQAIADGLLDDVMTQLNQQIDVNILPNPAIELGDFVNFKTVNGSAQARVVGIKYPVRGEMTLTLALPNFWWVTNG